MENDRTSFGESSSIYRMVVFDLKNVFIHFSREDELPPEKPTTEQFFGIKKKKTEVEGDLRLGEAGLKNISSL